MPIPAIIAVLLQIAAALGLPAAVSQLNKRAYKGMNSTAIRSTIDNMIAEASRKGNDVLSKLQSRLNAVAGISRYYSGQAKKVMANAEAKTREQLSNVEHSINTLNTEILTDANNLYNNASQLDLIDKGLNTQSKKDVLDSKQKLETKIKGTTSLLTDVDKSLGG